MFIDALQCGQGAVCKDGRGGGAVWLEYFCFFSHSSTGSRKAGARGLLPVWVRSRPQNLQTRASRLISSAQKGHFFMPSLSFVRSTAAVSAFIMRAAGNAIINIAAPKNHQRIKLRPLLWAIAAGIRPIKTATIRTSIRYLLVLSTTVLFYLLQVGCSKSGAIDFTSVRLGVFRGGVNGATGCGFGK